MKKQILSFFLICLMLAGLLSGCHTEPVKQYETLEDFTDAKIGVITGSAHDKTAQAFFPDAQRVYFNSMADMVLAVEQGKIHCYIEDAPFLTALIWEGIPLKPVEESVATMHNGFVFPQGDQSRPLRETVNEFLAQVKADGTVERLIQKWMAPTEPAEHPDYLALEPVNGTIRLAVSVDNKPLLYQKDGLCTGFEMDLLTLFGQQYGYAFEIEVVPFDSILAGIATGKYHMGASTLNITPEREESVDFSDPYATFDVVLVVQDTGRQSQITTLSQLDNGVIGIVTGTNWDMVAQENFPNAQRMYFTSTTDSLLALKQGKVDAIFADKTVYAGIRWADQDITCIDEPIERISNALILRKYDYDENLLSQINAFVAKCKKDGTLDTLAEKWFGDTEPEVHPDYTKLTGENGTLKIAIGDSMKPTAYLSGTTYTGYEVEFLTLFAQEYGYGLEMHGMAFEALIPSVASGKCDIGASGITITEERQENVTFAHSHFETFGVAVVRNDGHTTSSEPQKIETLQDLSNGKVAILTGTIWDGVAQQQIPQAERKYFSSMTDMFLSIQQGKVDALLGDRTFYVNARWEDVPVTVLEETVGSISCGFMLAKENYDLVLLSQLNEFIARSHEDGTLDTLAEKWLGEEEPTQHPDYRSLKGENGTIKVAVDDTSKPMTYRKNETFTGFDVEFLTLFAQEYGYRLEFEGMSFGALIPTVSSGKCDISACGTAITEERAESVTFTDCYQEVDGVVIVSQTEDTADHPTFLDQVAESFEKTFIREDRWKLILEGVGVTMLISICSAAGGTFLGFGLFMLSRSKAKLIRQLARGTAKVYSRLIAGTPVVVILMILFYVVFGSFRDMSGILVAIIGFCLTFGAFVYDHMIVSAGSVDPGQTEAAYALGYNKNKTFFRIVFPQAMSIFLPSYCGQMVDLVKATAVVGYIAVNDLTKMGDIIRSNTYEAFFPLIATAVIYFLLTWLLSLLLGMVRRRFEPKRRSTKTILKGVNAL